MTCAGQLVYGSDERLDHLVNETRRLLKQAPRRPTYMETPGAREIPRGGRLAVDYRLPGRERSTTIFGGT